MTTDRALKILMLAHELSDPAVQKRVMMLREGGAMVTVAGFRRTAEPVPSVAGCTTVNFGIHYNAEFVHRIWSVLREVVLLRRYRALFINADVIIARNLEALAIAVRGQALSNAAPALVYESLDVHPLLLDRGPVGAALRLLEGWLARRASALITSSPAFVSNYFNTLSKVRLPIRLIENKVLQTHEAAPPDCSLPVRPSGPPWIIGWFGFIRCKKSLQILAELVRQSEGTIEVVIRGRPALDQFDDFHKSTTETPGLRFLGSYKNPDDLASIYRGVHFAWAIDMLYEHQNSSWLLANRLYEGGLYCSVPIAQETVEMGRFLKRLGIGVAIREPLGSSLATFFKELTPVQYRALEAAAMNVPQAAWVHDREDCKGLVECLRSFSDMRHVSHCHSFL